MANETPDEVAKATFEWGSFFTTPTGKVIGALVIAIVAMLSSWLTDKIQPKPPAPPPTVVNVVPGGPELPAVPPIVEPPATNGGKVVLHLTAGAKDIPSSELLKGLTFQIDPKIYRDGSTYPFGGKQVPLPCMTKWNGGTVVDVQPFVNAAEVVAFVKKVVTP